MSKMTWDKFKKSGEYLLWEDLFRVAKEYGINEDTYFKKTDFSGEYWEPFFDRLYKMGSMLGFTKKLKEIRLDWMRPILYFGAQSTGVIEFDGRRDEINKGAIANAILVKFSFKSVINAVENFANLDEKNFHKEYIQFKKDIKYYFLQLSKFVKDGFLTMHNHVKLILKPLLDLRRGGYRLFALEQYEKNNKHLTIFNDTKDLSVFITSSKDFFMWEKYKQSKESEGEKLEEFINQNTSQERLVYHFSSEIRKKFTEGHLNPYATNAAFREDMEKYENKRYQNETKPKDKNTLVLPKIKKPKQKKDEKNYDFIIFPNISTLDQPQPTRLKYEAYQVQFENGFNSMIEYLNLRQNKDFPYIIDAHKMFVNIKFIPNGTKEPATGYYINQLLQHIEILKEKCYEMKLNGLSRILMPITENVEFIKMIKNVFDFHVIIDNVMGNYLLYEQYMFIYNQIKFLTNSSKKDLIENIKERYFMEEAIPKYVFFQCLCHSVKVLEKFKKYYKFEKGRIFQYKDSYQITQHDLDNEDNELIFAYEIYGPYKRFFVKELQDRKNKYDKEVTQFGRFWLMEGFFNKEDKNLWIEAIEALSNINELVREDIRDKILNEKDEKEKEKELFNSINSINKNDEENKETNLSNKRKDSSSSSLSSMVNIRKNSKIKIKTNRPSMRKKTKEKSLIKKKIIIRQQSTSSIDLNKINMDSFRPPNVWNYPIFRLRKLKIDKNDGKLAITNIRDVDPSKCYIDGRIEKFTKLFEQLYKNMRQYWNSGKKADTWDYFYDKVLKSLNIKYQTDKLLRREKMRKAMEEEQKRKEEEEQKKKEEEEKKKEEEMKKEEEDKKEELNINIEEEQKSKEQNISIKLNSIIINSENTASSNAMNTNTNSSFRIKKLKIKPKGIPRNKKNDDITNETTA